jgi:hypothetical protein
MENKCDEIALIKSLSYRIVTLNCLYKLVQGQMAIDAAMKICGFKVHQSSCGNMMCHLIFKSDDNVANGYKI